MLRKILLLLVLTTACAAAEPPGELRTVPQVDLERYAGRWHEIARLPNRFQEKCAGEVSADYSLRDDGRIAVVNRCSKRGGGTMEADGVARVVDTETRAKLKVRFAPAWLSWLPAVWGDYQVIDLADDYSWAVVGEPRRRYLWILARKPRLDDELLDAIRARIAAQGFDVQALVRTRQNR